MRVKLPLGAAMVLAGAALVSSCCDNERDYFPQSCVEGSEGDIRVGRLDANVPSLPAPRADRLPLAAVSGPTCPAVNFLQGSAVIYGGVANYLYASGLQRQPDGSFTRWRYNSYAPYSFFDSTPEYQSAFWNCNPAGARTFKNPPGWVPLADRPGAMSQALVFANLLGNGTPVGLAIVPANFNRGPSAPSLMVAIPNPDGTAKSFNFYAVPSGAQSILTGDFNHDGKEDVVVIAFTDNNGDYSNGVAVYLGNGDGTLQSPKLSSGHQATIQAVAYDFNGDGNLDLAVLNGLSSDVSILLGNSDGTFAPAVNYPAVAGGQSIVAGDFNGDGHVDLAVSGSNSVVVLPGNGNGTFRAAIKTPLAFSYAASLAAGDFNHDGELDLAAVSGSLAGGFVSVLLGDGTGKFPTEYDYVAPAESTNLYAMDLDGDGSLDVVVASGHPDLLTPNENVNNITAFFGRGDGTLIGPPAYPTGATEINATAIADFNGDGKLDIAVASGQLWILLASGGGNFKTPVPINLGSGVSANGVAAADLNGDGKQDLVVGDFNASGLYVLLGNGDGTFQTPVPYSVGGGTVTSVAIADFNGDGKPDIAFSGAGFAPPTGSTAGILPGNGNGTFQAASNLSGFGTAPVALAVGDFNNDGKPDLAIVDQGYSASSIPGGLVVYINKGNGTFQAPANYSVGINPVSLTTAGGNLMVVTEDPNFKTNSQFDVAVLVGNGNGTFKSASFVATAANPTSITTADLNGDGKPDLAIAHCCLLTYMTYMLGNGDGTFQTEVALPTTVAASTIAAADVNGDGKPDLIAGIGLRVGYVSIFLNTTTTTGIPAPVSSGPASGSGSSQTFTFTFSDSAGYQNLGVVDILIQNVLDGRHACYIAFVPSGAASGVIDLVDDAGDAGGPYSFAQLPGSGTAQNSQCSISAANSSVSGSGNTLTLTLAIAFSASFAGNRVLYLSAQDKSLANSGWSALGTWNVPGPPVSGPSVTGMSPGYTTSLGPTTYTFTFSDTNGWQDIGVANILINSAIDGRQACYIAYVPSTASVLLVDDAGDAGGPYQGMVLPGSGSVSNSQCTISGTGSSVSGSGNTLTLKLAVTFATSFAGDRLFFLAARNNTLNSNWQAVGTAVVP